MARSGSGVYNLTKHGVGAFSESLRQEVTGRHVRVSLVEPGRRRHRARLPQPARDPRADRASASAASSAWRPRTSPTRSPTSSPGPGTWRSTRCSIRPTEQEAEPRPGAPTRGARASGGRPADWPRPLNVPYSLPRSDRRRSGATSTQEIPCKKDSPSPAPARSRAASPPPPPRHGEVVLWARSGSSAERAAASVAKQCEKLPTSELEPGRVRVVTDLDALADGDLPRRGRGRGPGPQGPQLLAELARPRGPRRDPGHDHLVAVDRRAGPGQRAPGPVRRACTSSTRCRGWSWSSSSSARGRRDEVRERARALCEALGKTAGGGARHARLRRQPAAVPLPVQRRRADVADRH